MVSYKTLFDAKKNILKYTLLQGNNNNNKMLQLKH